MKALGSAHSGTLAWLVQRGTAWILAIVLPLLLLRVALAVPVDHAGWQALFAPVWVRLGWVFAALALALHAWIGMRDILMDYVRPLAVRLVLDVCVLAVLVASVAGLVAALWRPA